MIERLIAGAKEMETSNRRLEARWRYQPRARTDQIRRAVMNKELMKRSSGERLGRVTISIGVALLRPTDTPQSLLDRADKCLYAAKHNGRNQVVAECDLEAKATVAPPAPARVA